MSQGSHFFPTLGIIAFAWLGCASDDSHPPQLGALNVAGAPGQGSGGSHAGSGGTTDSGSGGSSLGGSSGSGGTSLGGSGGSSGDGGAGGSSGAAPFPYVSATLTQVLSDAPWGIGQHAPGMAVDDDGKVYVANDEVIYQVDGATVTEYMTMQDAAAVTGDLVHTMRFFDLDRGPDNQLYLRTYDWLIQSAAAHQGAIFREMQSSGPTKIGVATPTLVAAVDADGLWTVAPTGQTLVYGDTVLKSTDCATEDLAVQASGEFLYQPGCNGSSLVVGNLDGSGTQTMFDMTEDNSLDASNFQCSARSPGGGFYVVVSRRFNSYPIMYHFDEGFTEIDGIQRIATTPSFEQVEAANTETFAFHYCAIAVAPNGSVYFQTMKQLWRIDF